MQYKLISEASLRLDAYKLVIGSVHVIECYSIEISPVIL